MVTPLDNHRPLREWYGYCPYIFIGLRKRNKKSSMTEPGRAGFRPEPFSSEVLKCQDFSQYQLECWLRQRVCFLELLCCTYS